MDLTKTRGTKKITNFITRLKSFRHGNKTSAFYATALVLALAHSSAAVAGSTKLSDKIIYLKQGWDAEVRELFYYTPQGSRLMPFSWFIVLEQARSTKRFASAKNLARFGWLKPTEKVTPLNPGGLPVGFALDPVNVKGTGKWVGLTCAACHTNDVTYQGKQLRIDGAPTLADFGTFLTELSIAVNATLLDENKFKRFALNVLGAKATKNQITELRSAYLAFTNRLTGRTWMRTPPLPAGAGRVDALGQIINALAVFDLEVPDNLRPPSAPVSYPFLWYTPHLAWVQWNPIASNPISRNAGEVLGVFGHAQFTGSKLEQVDLKAKIKVSTDLQQLAKDLVPRNMRKDILGPIDQKLAKLSAKIHRAEGGKKSGMLSSTVLYKNLNDLENWLRDLKSPRWDDELLGPLNKELAMEGAKLFKQHCRACHNMPPFDMTPKEENIIGKQFITIGRINYKTVGTDPTYVENLISRFTATGDLESILFDNQSVVPAASFFLGTVGPVVKKGMINLGLTPDQMLEYSDYRFYPPKDGEEPKSYAPPNITSLKAGPMLGIWATAPFLHNGSVPNIYELLSAPEERSKVFWVGNRELDTKKLGFIADEQPELFRFNTQLPGNSNQGHIYPRRPYGHEQKMAVIEFLKDPYRFLKGEEK